MTTTQTTKMLYTQTIKPRHGGFGLWQGKDLQLGGNPEDYDGNDMSDDTMIREYIGEAGGAGTTMIAAPEMDGITIDAEGDIYRCTDEDGNEHYMAISVR